MREGVRKVNQCRVGKEVLETLEEGLWEEGTLLVWLGMVVCLGEARRQLPRRKVLARRLQAETSLQVAILNQAVYTNDTGL